MEEVLKDKPKDAPILTYCTGGIRCVKINAYLEQKMGFKNVGRLAGGIISYTKEIENMAAASKKGEVVSSERGELRSNTAMEMGSEAGIVAPTSTSTSTSTESKVFELTESSEQAAEAKSIQVASVEEEIMSTAAQVNSS
jgi:predicted sulfurtransferase